MKAARRCLRCEDRERFDTPAELDRRRPRDRESGWDSRRYVRDVHQAQIVMHPDNRGVFAELRRAGPM
jgi:hypothetical protein